MTLVLDELLAFREDYLRQGGNNTNILLQISNLEKEILNTRSKHDTSNNGILDEIKTNHEKEILVLENEREKSILQYEIEQLHCKENDQYYVVDIADLKKAKYIKEIGFVLEFLFCKTQDNDSNIKLTFSIFQGDKAKTSIKTIHSKENSRGVYILSQKQSYSKFDSNDGVKVIMDVRKLTESSREKKIGWTSFPIFNKNGDLHYGHWKINLNYYPINFIDETFDNSQKNFNCQIVYRIYPNYSPQPERLLKLIADESIYLNFQCQKEYKSEMPAQSTDVVLPPELKIEPLGEPNIVTSKKLPFLKQDKHKHESKNIKQEQKNAPQKTNTEATAEQPISTTNEEKVTKKVDINDGSQSIILEGETLIGKANLPVRVYKPKFGRPAIKKFCPRLIVPDIPEEAFYFVPVQVDDSGSKDDISSITIYIDAGKRSLLKNCKIVTKQDLDQSVYNPEYKYSVTFKKGDVPAYSLLLLEIQTLDIISREITTVGFASVPLFSAAESQKPTDFKYLFGAFQIPIYVDPFKQENWGSFWKPNGMKRFERALIKGPEISANEGEIAEYSSKQFQTFEVDKPLSSDLNLYYFVYSQKKSFSVRDRLLAMGDIPKTVTQTEESLTVWATKLFEQKRSIAESIDLSYIAKYDPAYGFKIAIDKAENLEQKGFTVAVISFSTYPFKKDQKLNLKYPNDILYTKFTNLNSEYKHPEFDDGYFWYRRRNFNQDVWTIIELFSISNEEIDSIGWTACPVFHPQKYVRMGRYQLPLFEGDIDIESLMPYTTFEDAWKNEELSVSKNFGSVTIRIVDGRRESEITKESNISAYFLGASSSKFKKSGYSNLVKSLKPKKLSNEEFVEQAYAAFVDYTNLPYIP
ncbi:Coiled-coil domain-containing protein 17 [Terramyces sp. JEL0728]|nr:Coiled-coil domain-containing protein 17 [Terramyces sp. JEL0728]